MTANCDYNGDGSIDQCEAFNCIVASENAFRLQHCEIGAIACECPFWED